MSYLSTKSFLIASLREFQDRVLMLSLGQAHEIMNLSTKDDDTGKLQARASELINQPEQFRERLALSVAALLSEDEVGEYFESGLDDIDLAEKIVDAFDGMAGVSRERE